MKIAIFHNFLDNIGGAEIVDLMLAKELKADIYTTNIDKEKIEKMGFSTKNIHSIGKIPLNAPFRHEFAYWKFKRLNLTQKYDFFIIAGDWALSASKHNKPNLWYVYSPKREIWDLKDYTRNKIVPWHQRFFYDVWVMIRRYLDLKDVENVGKIIATSKNVRNRIKKYLLKPSKVIYPALNTKEFKYKRNGDFWLSVNRLITHKRVDMQLKAFSKIPNEKLVIVGSYEKSRHFLKYVRYLNKIKPKNVEIINWVDNEKLKELYANCKGFITTSKEEDFGLTPLEAMASGKPVIAPNEGGYKETIISGETGVLINNINPGKIVKAVEVIGKDPKKYKNACIKQSKKFDIKILSDKIRKEIGLNG